MPSSSNCISADIRFLKCVVLLYLSWGFMQLDKRLFHKSFMDNFIFIQEFYWDGWENTGGILLIYLGAIKVCLTMFLAFPPACFSNSKSTNFNIFHSRDKLKHSHIIKCWFWVFSPSTYPFLLPLYYKQQKEIKPYLHHFSWKSPWLNIDQKVLLSNTTTVQRSTAKN